VEAFRKGQKDSRQRREPGKEAKTVPAVGKLQMALSGLKKSHSCSMPVELRKLVDHEPTRNHDQPSVRALGTQIHAVTTSPIPVPENPPWIMARIDALYLRSNLWKPSMVSDLGPRRDSRSAVTVGPKLTAGMGLRHPYQKPRNHGAQVTHRSAFPAWLDSMESRGKGIRFWATDITYIPLTEGFPLPWCRCGSFSPGCSNWKLSNSP